MSDFGNNAASAVMNTQLQVSSLLGPKAETVENVLVCVSDKTQIHISSVEGEQGKGQNEGAETKDWEVITPC